MKKFLLLNLITCLSIGLFAQTTIFSSDFENWNVNNPVNWGGSATSIDTVNKVVKSTDVHGGSFALQLINDTTSHKRYATTTMNVTSGQAYAVKFWAKGQGNIRVGYFDGGTGYAYTSYTALNSATYTQITHTITASSASGQFMLSVQSSVAPNHIIVDDLSIKDTTIATVSIYDIQYTTDASGNSPKKDQIVTFSGTCTAVHTGKGYYLKDGPGPWRGIYVYTNNTNTPQVGDSVQVTGTVVEFNSLTEVTNSTYTLKSVGNSLTPNIATCSQLNTEAYEGVFCKVKNVQVTAMPASFGIWTINDGAQLKVDDDMYAPGTTIALNSYYDITGICTYTYAEWKILPRSAGDITAPSSVNDMTLGKYSRVYPNPASDVINIENNLNIKNFEVFNVIGSKVIDSNVNNNGVTSINLNGLQKGIYILKINYKSNISETVKFVKE